MKELVNHFVFDSVSLQIVALVLLAFWMQARRLYNRNATWYMVPKEVSIESAWLAVWLFALIGSCSAYYGAPLATVGKVGLWALHVGILALVRWYYTGKRFEDFARFEAIASLGILFLKQ
jgi:hypothetical protein